MCPVQTEGGDRYKCPLSILWASDTLQRTRSSDQRTESPMTLVTTSRRSTTESRGVAKDLAFALGARYVARGKRGIREFLDTESSFFIISYDEKGLMLRWYYNGSPELERKITTYECRTREGVLTRGIITSDKGLYERLNPLFPVFIQDDEIPVLIIDGPQRRQSFLKLGKTD